MLTAWEIVSAIEKQPMLAFLQLYQNKWSPISTYWALSTQNWALTLTDTHESLHIDSPEDCVPHRNTLQKRVKACIPSRYRVK